MNEPDTPVELPVTGEKSPCTCENCQCHEGQRGRHGPHGHKHGGRRGLMLYAALVATFALALALAAFVVAIDNGNSDSQQTPHRMHSPQQWDRQIN